MRPTSCNELPAAAGPHTRVRSYTCSAVCDGQFLQRRLDLLHVPQRYREAVEDRMDSMKEWLLRKCRIPNIAAVPLPEAVSPPCKERTSPGFSAVVTPQNIPEFVIPGSGESSRHASLGTCSNEDLGSQSSASLPCSAHTSPGVSPRNSFSSLAVPARPPALSRSAPVSPRHEPRDFMAEFGVRSMNSLACGGGGDTNADPQSIAAMSLPHFRAQTSFGFSTLSESPHTRRKESLFMHPGDLLSVHALQQQQQHLQLQQQQREQLQHPPVPPMRPKSNSWDTVRTTESPSFVLCDLTNSKCLRGQLTPACAPPSPPISGQLAARTSSRRCNFYFRRRSSLADLENDDSCDDVSPVVSPDLKRKSLVRARAASFCRCRPSMRREGTLGEDCNGALHCGEEARQPRCCQACQCVISSLPTHGAKAGEIKLGFQLLPESRQLRVDLIKADNLESPQKHLSPFAKLCLMPGKLQRQVSKVVKHTREPIFNESFWFNNVDEEGLKERTLRVKLFHKGQNLKPNEYIGETLVPLESYDLLRDNRMWMALYPRIEVQDLGQLLLSTTFEPREERLRVMINQARGLPQHHITGPPDPYVRVEVFQGRKEVGKTQTRTRKNAVQPVFKETFTFQISPRLEDLKYTTVKVTLLDHDRLRSDDVIGEVYLGFGATEDTELTHWEETVQKPGQEVTMWHYVMEENKRP